MRDFSKSEYAKSVAAADAKIQDLDRYRCHYAIDGIRCSARGSICESTMGPEKGQEDRRRWLCPAHYQLRDDPLGSREVLADLATHSPKRPEDWREKMLEDAGLGELQQAWRDMGEEERRNLVAQTARKARGFVRQTAVRQQGPGPGPARNVGPERERQLDALYRAMTPEQRAEFERRTGGAAA